MQALPVDSLLPEIIRSFLRSPNLVIEAPPGAGKTTRVPAALLDAGLAGGGEVWVLEPRRLAARMSARRVAEERGERLGETVGYQVRFEEVTSPRTRLRFLTEGVLTRRLLRDPRLSGVSVVVLDEFHERHLQADLALALLRRLQKGARPDLRIVAMSATLDSAPVARHLGGCPTLRSEGRRFEVKIEHLMRPDERSPAEQVYGAARRLVAENVDGDVLVFLPGAAEIRRAQEACAPLASESDVLVVPLHGDLPPGEQDRAVRPASRRRIILSTNVAETSVTIEGVAAVVDSGLARVAGHSPWSGLPTLTVRRVSQASAAQRAGRAGRTRPGRCLRLYTAQDFAARQAYEAPEIERLDLAEAALELHSAGVADLTSFEWFEPPPASALAAAETLLRRLGAVDARGEVTALGKHMLRFPLHPRLARLVVEAESRGVAREACVIAALISERDIRASRVLTEPRARHAADAAAEGSSDLLAQLDLFAEAEAADFAAERLRQMYLDPVAVRSVDRVRRRLERSGDGGGRGAKGGERAGELSSAKESELLISILTGYPDRVARRRAASIGIKEAGDELLLSGGGSAELAPESVARRAEFLVAVDAEVRQDSGGGRPARRGGRTVVRLASAIEPEWLIDLFADRIGETVEATWNARHERVEIIERLVYDELTLDESRARQIGGREVESEAGRVLAEAAMAAGFGAFTDPQTIDRYLARVEFMRQTFPRDNFPALGEDEVRAVLIGLCEGRRGFAELRKAVEAGGLLEGLRQRLEVEQLRLMETMAPERVSLAGRRQARVNYERDRTPWIASMMRDFFGMNEGPKIADGRVPVVLHLLAPNGRPVQVTDDLAGFWTRHYPRVRRELGRRYPRHAWPEDPLQPPPTESRR